MPEIRMFDLTPSPMPLSRLRPAPFRSRRCFLPLSAVAAFLALAGLAATAAPQEPSQQPGASAGEGTGGSGSGVLVREGRPVFEESVEVHLMNVEVFVSDRKGRPIRGLEVEDFELYENGELMEITHFAEAKGSTAVGTVDFGRGKVGGEGADTADLPAFTESSVVAPSYLVVFVDNTHLRPAGRKRTIESLRSFLATDTVPSERVLIVAQTPDLRTLAPFGSTYEALDSALARLDEMPAHGHEKDRDRQLLTSQLADIYKLAQSTPFLDPCEELANAGQRAVEAYSQRVKGRAATTLRHLAALSSGLAGVPGNKILFYVSDGLEVQPGVDFSHQLIEICPHRRRDFELLASRVDILDRFRQLTRHANANRVSFYTFDAMGHRAGSTVSAEASDFEWTPSSATDHVRVANLQSSLSYLASDTGGRAVFGQTDIRDELEEIAQDMSYFYSLAYNPDHRGDDRTHVIDVRVPGKRKARIRHRMTYRDKPAEERMADRLQTALTLGIEDNPLAASLAHGEIRELGGRDSYEVPLRVTVPLRGLVFLPQAGSHLGTLRLQVAARDADGRVAAFHQKRFEVELDPGLAGEAEGEHTFVVPLKMRGGEHVVAVGIRDETGRATSYLASRLVVQTTPVAAGGR